MPHQFFSFSKLWVAYSKFLIRMLKLDEARKVLGTAIGKAPSEKIFKEYSNLELKLANLDRCRKINEKYLQVFPHSSEAWIHYA